MSSRPSSPRIPPSRRGLTDAGLNFIAGWEGFVPYAYNDPAGHATAGFGHLIHLGNVTVADAERYGSRAHPKLSRAEGLALLRRDANDAVRSVRSHVKVPVNRFEFNARVSLRFNIGASGFAHSSVVRELNSGHRARAGASFLLWSRAGGHTLAGLLNRRRAERQLFRTIR
jgi:lysozyme